MNQLNCEIAMDRSLNFAMYNNDVPLVKNISITNTGEENLHNIDIKLTFWPEFADEYEYHINELPANAEVTVNPVNVKINPEYLYSLSERMKGQITLTAVSNDLTIFQRKEEVVLLAFDEWNGGLSLPEIIAAFVIPNSILINNIIKQSAIYMGKWTGNSAMDGYQSGDPNRAKQQMAAIFHAVKDLRFAYANPPASFEAIGQRIRLPEMMMQTNTGTCMDFSLLYAGALEAAGLNPLVIMIQEHAFAGAWLVNETFPEGAFSDYSMLIKRTVEGINEICMVETTAMTDNKTLSFDDAAGIAMSHFTEPDKFHYFVDIKRSRISQIRPLPLRSEYQNYSEYQESRAKADMMNPDAIASAPSQINKIQFIEAKEREVSTRIQNWQKQLLDLSLRNNLLNLKFTSSTITLLCPDIYALEDALSAGKEFGMLPIPAEMVDNVRDFETYKSRTGNTIWADVTASEFRQGRLRTMLPEKVLFKSVVDIYRKAKTNMEENGANILYLALGTLRWYETPASEIPRYAPLILYPLEIVKKSATFGYIIRKRDEDAIFNYTLVEFLRNTYGIDLSNVEQLPSDENGYDVKKIFAIINHQVMTMSRWGVEETAVISAFSFNKFVMWNDLRLHAEELQKSKVVKALMNGSADLTFTDSTKAFNTGERLDDVLGSYSGLYTPISADSSQMKAIFAANAGESFVLHGPPGTGKSQTITNMIANMIGNGKTVLFVAEKMAALSVVEKRLSAVGLAPFCLELHSNKSSKKDILKKLEDTMNLGSYQNSADWNMTLAEIEKVKAKLNGYVEALHTPHAIGFSVFDSIQKLNELKSAENLPLFKPEEAYAYTEEQLMEAKEYVRKLAVAGKSCGQPYQNPLQEIRQKSYSLTLAQNLPGLLLNSIKSYNEMKEDVVTFESFFGAGIKISDVTLKDLILLSEMCGISLNGYNITAEIWNTDYAWMKLQIELSEKYVSMRSELLQRYDERIEQIEIDRIIAEYNISQNKFLFSKMAGKNKVFKELMQFARLGAKPDRKHLADELARIKEFISIQIQFRQSHPAFLNIFGKTVTLSDDFRLYSKTISLAEQLHTVWKKINDRELSSAIKANLSRIAGFSGDQRQTCMERLDRFINGVKEVLQQTDSDMENHTTGMICETFESWRQNLSNLQNTCAYNAVAAEAQKVNLVQIVKAYESGQIKISVANSFEKAFYTAWFDKAFGNTPELKEFIKEIHEDEISKFTDLDNRYTALVRQEIFARLVSGLPRYSENVNAASEVGILTRAIHSGGRGVALRKLFSNIPNLLSKLAPCMLMSPISAAQYLEVGFPLFDVVIFDEASQMPTHEAIGAIARGRSLIVVGDPKQLPPTTFFSARQTEPDEDVMLADLESILDDCMAVNMPSKSLTWHYRSRHESLIAFSNHNFYEGKLLTFPSYDDENTQISLINTNGIYQRGTTRQNKIEALAVIDAIVRLSKESPDRSIGVVALSQAQQTLIEDLLDERYHSDPDLEKYNADIYEPTFIKNLENVQGDERDIIIFSVGYGKDEKGYMGMNFGPINKNGGWRRLNVAISRARQRLLIFSSIEAQDIDLARSSMPGVVYLRNFLQYARSKAKYISTTETAEIFETTEYAIEKDIMNKLREKGYTVHQNVGKSKFKIPLAVLNDKGRYILGIQFDGHFYRNAKTARDRDILLDSVLRGLNWNIYHVWSQKWISEPEEELRNILDILEAGKDPEDIKKAPPAEEYTADFTTNIGNDLKHEKEVLYYRTAVLDEVLLPSESFYNQQSNGIILEQINRIIDAEAPVSFVTICRKITAAWGMKRVGKKISDRITGLICEIPCSKAGNNIYYWGNITLADYQGYRMPKNEQERRQPEDIAPTEILNAAKEVIEQQIALSEAGLAKEVANLFGYTRVAESTAEKFAAVLRYGKEHGVLKTDGNGKYIN